MDTVFRVKNVGSEIGAGIGYLSRYENQRKGRGRLWYYISRMEITQQVIVWLSGALYDVWYVMSKIVWSTRYTSHVTWWKKLSKKAAKIHVIKKTRDIWNSENMKWTRSCDQKTCDFWKHEVNTVEIQQVTWSKVSFSANFKTVEFRKFRDFVILTEGPWLCQNHKISTPEAQALRPRGTRNPF